VLLGGGPTSSLGVIGFAEALEQLRINLILMLQDWYKIRAAITTALFAHIPVI
jgi:hypothetical protein